MNGCEVEIAGKDEYGTFMVAWYPGIVKGQSNDAVWIQYEGNTVEARAPFDQVRPRPPPEVFWAFKPCDRVEGFYQCAWWECFVTDVLQRGEYLIYVRELEKTVILTKPHLREYREWVIDRWVPPPPHVKDFIPQFREAVPGIMGFLDAEDIARASLVSKMWNIQFKDASTIRYSRSALASRRARRIFNRFVSWVTSYLNPHVDLEVVKVKSSMDSSDLDTLVKYALGRGVNELDITLESCYDDSFPFISLSSVCVSQILRSLSLSFSWNPWKITLPMDLQTPQLDALYLEGLCLSGADCVEPFSKLRKLSSITLLDCCLVQKDSFLHVSSATTVTLHIANFSHSRKIVISTPNLKHFGLTSECEQELASTSDMPGLEDVYFDFYGAIGKWLRVCADMKTLVLPMQILQHILKVTCLLV